MLAHPLVGQWPLAPELLDRMLEAEEGVRVADAGEAEAAP